MDNRDILIFCIVIFMIYVLYCQKNNEKNNEKLKNNLDNFTSSENIEINEGLKNLGIIANELNNSDRLIIPANVTIKGDTNAALLYSIILWGDEEPPYPNINQFTTTNTSPNGLPFGYRLLDTDEWYPCVGGVINVDGIDITIPDMRNRMIVGYGPTDNNTTTAHQFNDPPGTHVGGDLPLRPHRHNGRTGNDGDHKHIIPAVDGYRHGTRDGCNSTNCYLVEKTLEPVYGSNIYQTLTDRHFSSDNFANDVRTNIDINSSGHRHTVHTRERGAYNNYSSHGLNKYAGVNIPHAIVLQYWIKVR